MANIERADAKTLASSTGNALNVADAATQREIGALHSIEEVYTGTPAARKMLTNRLQQWELYRTTFKNQVLGYAKIKAADLGVEVPAPPAASALEKKCQTIIPALAKPVKGQLFQLSGYEPYSKYMKEHPDALKSIGLTAPQAGAILNYVNGRRSISEIRGAVTGEINEDITLEKVVAYLELLKTVQWVVF